MAALSQLLVLIGLVSLFHAAYSAHEHSTLASLRHAKLPSNSPPLDIQVETVVSVFLVCLGLVLGAEPLRPISWSVWAGKIEKEGGGRNPFRGLEDRVGFMDIRAKRREFADWVRDRDTIDQTI